MADDKPRPPQRAWRDAVNPTGHAAKGGPAWKGGVDDTKGGKQPWSKNARLALAACLFGGVVAVTVIVILWLWPLKPPLLVVLSAGYETNLAIPQNAPGRAAAREFAEWGRGEGKENFKGVEQGDLTSNLESLRKTLAASRAKTVVLFLAAHGSADEEGVYLVPQDADIKDRAKSRVRLDQILTLLGEELPSGSKKLLILDATQVTASWTLGLFHNDFARQLKGLEDRIKAIPGLVVIAASGEDQRSWVSEEWRQSVFAHHVLQGLRGAAGKGGRGITAQDLFDYVKAKVTHWARHNRGSLQTPLLLGKEQVAREMELVVASGTPPPDNFKKAPVLPPDLARAWTDHDKLAAQTPPPATYTPHRWRRYQDSLVRYEQLLRAGDDASAKVLLDSLTLLHQKIFAARALKIDSALGSLAMPAALGWDLPPVDEAKLSELKALLEKKNKQDAKKNYAEWLGTEKEQWKKRLLRVRLGGELLALAAEDPGRYLEPLRDLLAAPEDIDAPRPAEVQYLALLTHKDELAPQLPQPSWDLVKEALLLRRLAEEAAVGLAEGEARGRQPIPYSEAVLPWIRENLDNADRERRLGQDLLLASKDTDLKEAVERLGKARTLYREIQTVAPRVRAAMLVRDRALADLPYYSQWVAGRRFIGRAQLKKYREPIDSQLELWQAVNALDRQLQQPGVIGPELDKLTGAVKTGLKKIQDEVADLSKQEFAAHQEKWHEIEGLLSTPFIPAKRRLALLGRLREISEKLSQVEADKGGGDVGMTAPDAQLLARESARAQGQLALSALGEEVFKASKGRSDFGQMRQAIWDAP
ncbi:MAG TPA: hypothetical protein VEL76_31185, partial [Gemmataceae bacterium]|nr:hypothetical protein [Gemmataceae bacterium]